MASDAPNPETIRSPTTPSFAPSHSRTSSAESTASTDSEAQASAGAILTATSSNSTTTAPRTPAPTASSFSLGPLPAKLLQQQRRPRIQTGRPKPRPKLEPILTRLRYPLAPLHPLPSGAPHPSFPPTLLSYHLLTEEQLDSLARYYHQLTSPGTQPCMWTHGYPTLMENYDMSFLQFLGEEKGLEARVRAKRRMWGKFIGLKGCEVSGEEEGARDRWERRREMVAVKGLGGRW